MQDSGRKVLVTGGAGYLGSVLLPVLLGRGHQVRLLDRFYFGRASISPFSGQSQVEAVDGDVAELGALPGVLDDIDTVIHLASISNDPSCDLDPSLTIRTNYLATIDLARRAKSAGVKRFVFVSSCSVYGASGELLLDESSPTGPLTLYALTKLISEYELLGLSEPTFPVTILRLATLFGYSPRMRFDLAVNTMTKRALQGLKLIVHGGGAQYRPFLHVGDAADTLAATIEAHPLAVQSQILNVGRDDLNYSIADLAVEMQEIFPSLEVETTLRDADMRSYRVHFGKLKQLLGMAPSRSIRDGVREIVEAHEFERLIDMDADRYYNLAVMKEAHPAPTLPTSPATLPGSRVPAADVPGALQ